MEETPQKRTPRKARQATQSRSPSPSPSPSSRARPRPSPAQATKGSAKQRWAVAATALLAMAAAAWWQPHLHGHRWPFVGGPARPSERLQGVKEWVPPRSVAQDEARAFTASHLPPHLRVDETVVRAKDKATPLVLRRPLSHPALPTATPGEASKGVVILANGRDVDLLSKCYALISVIREVFFDPIPIAVFHLGHAESFSPTAIGAFAALGNVTVADLGASTGLPAAQRWPGGLGFLSKPRAALAGLLRWQSVLLLDADSVLFQPPSAFFEVVSFRQTGLALWRDHHPCFTSLSPYLLQRMRINSTAFCAATRRQESDSSAVVVGGLLGHTVEASRCAATAAVALCEHNGEKPGSDSSGDLHTQKLMLGDKDSWAIGAALCGMGVESSVHAHPPGAFAIEQAPLQRLSTGSSSAANERGLTVAVFNGQVQFDDDGDPLYWNGNGQSARDLTKALAAASTPAIDGRTSTERRPDSDKGSLQYLRNLPAMKLKPIRASELYGDDAALHKARKLERAEEITISKISRGKLLSAPPMVMQALTAAADAIAKLATMDGFNGDGAINNDADIATEDLFQVVTTMMQRGRRLQHAKRAGSALVQLDRAASLACARTETSTTSEAHADGDTAAQPQLTPQSDLLALCATATQTLADSLSAHGNAAAAARAYRKVISLIEKRNSTAVRTDNTGGIELPDKVHVMLLLAECLAERRNRGQDDTAAAVSEALALIEKVLQINPSSVAGRLHHGTLLLRAIRETTTASTSDTSTGTQGRESLASRQDAALNDFNVAIALSEESGSATSCASAHVKRGRLLESWADVKVGPRIAEAHESYAAALGLIPQDEEAKAGFKRTLVAVPVPATGANVTASPPVLAEEPRVPQQMCTPGEEEVRSSTNTSNNSGGITCVPCATGTFDHDRNPASPCRRCRPGFTSPEGSILCLSVLSRCESGHVEKLPAAALASALAARAMQAQSKVKGLFRNHQGLQLGMHSVEGQQQLDCVACSEGTFDHDRSASTPCVKCRQGMYSPPRSVVCVGPSRVSSVVQNMAEADQPINSSRLRKP
eukprot:COSAG02_NODE_1399_length_12852_cov_83.666745_2_plen_1057_part_00